MSQELVASESPRRADRSVVNWVLIAAVFLAAIIIDDRAPWPYVMTPLYALPVLIAAWRQRPGEAIITAIVANLINAASGVIQGTPTIIWLLYSSGLIFIGALAVLVSSQRQRVQRRERETADARQQLALQYAVARTLAEAATLHDAQVSLLRVVGEHSGWGPGIFWSVNPAGTALICRAIWYRSGVELPAFDSRSRHTSLPPGVGLPGRIWATGETIWVPDVLEAVNFPRKEAAAAARLHSAFGFPIRANSRVLGVMEFFSSEIRRPDPALLALFKALGSQIGQFVERKRAEEERTDLLAREQAARAEADAERARLETVLHNSASGIIFVDADTGRVTGNPRAEEIYGHPINPEAGPAQFCGQVHTPDGAPVPLNQLPTSEALRGQTVRDRELVIIQPTGQRVPILANATSIRRPDGSISGAVVTFQDISAIKELERMRDEWVSLIAHDLRQPVTVISGHTQLLRRLLTRHASPEKEQQTIDNILTSAHNLDRMIGDLLDASRIETRHLKIEKRPVDFASLIRGVVERSALVARGHPVCLETRGEIPWLEVDPGRIDQALGNLLSNAAKYAYPDTEIRVEVARKGGEVEVSVTDHGDGIAADELPRLFTRFYRTREAREKGVAGLGLGLYLSAKLIQANGGRLWAESIPHESTTFRFTLPIRDAR